MSKEKVEVPIKETEEVVDNVVNGESFGADFGSTVGDLIQTATEETAEVIDSQSELDDLLSDVDDLVYKPEEFSRTNPPFAPTRERFNGLNLGKIVLIEITKVLTPTLDEKGNVSEYEYAGLELNKIHIQIDSADGVLPIKSYHHNFTLPVKTANNGTLLTPKFYNDLVSAVYNMIQELFTALTTPTVLKADGATVTGLNQDAFKLFPQYDSNKERRVKKWNLATQLLVDSFNNNKTINGKSQPVFVSKTGESLPIWFILTPSYASKRSKFELPDRVGSGVFEVANVDTKGQLKPALISIPSNVSLTLIPKPQKKGSKEQGSTEMENLAANGLSAQASGETGDWKF